MKRLTSNRPCTTCMVVALSLAGAIGTSPQALGAVSAVPTGRASSIGISGIVNDSFGPGPPYADSSTDFTLFGVFIDAISDSSTSPTGHHVISSGAAQGSSLNLGFSDVDGLFLRGGGGTGAADALHDVLGMTPGGGPGIADSFFDVFFTVPLFSSADFRLKGSLDSSGAAGAVAKLIDETGVPFDVFSTSSSGAFVPVDFSVTLLPGLYHLQIAAHADAAVGGSHAEFALLFWTPEPSTWALSILGMLGVWSLGRRARRRR